MSAALPVHGPRSAMISRTQAASGSASITLKVAPHRLRRGDIHDDLRACTHKIAIGGSDLITFQVGPLLAVRADVPKKNSDD
jgi:hypothetical protein